MHCAVCSRHENTLLFEAGTRTTLQFIGLLFCAPDILWCNMAAAKFSDGREFDVARNLGLEFRARRLTALAQRRLPKLGSLTVAFLVVGGRPAISESITPLSTITTNIINFREIIISGIITAGVTIARVTSARAPVALGISAALMSVTAPAAALAVVAVTAARITSTTATRPRPAGVPTTAVSPRWTVLGSCTFGVGGVDPGATA
jgi:hypothetical protein